jgi:nicotinamidase-related amidase
MTMHDILLVVIDAQRAFVDPAGSLARTYGIDELRPGVEVLARLRTYLGQCGAGVCPVFVRSEYRPGQFTQGRMDDPLADLCVPGRNIDCDWAAGLDTTRASTIITKQQADAGETEAYKALVERAVRDGTRQIVLTGFQLTTCVRASALTTLRLVGGSGARVVVAEALAGARTSSYVQTATGSRVEAARRELRAAGVLVTAGVDHGV